MPEIKPCDRCGRSTPRRYLWTVGVTVNPTNSWELCSFCNELILEEMRYANE